MRHITQVLVTYDDGAVELFRGRGSAHESHTHASPSRDMPKTDEPLIHYLQLHLNITEKSKVGE